MDARSKESVQGKIDRMTIGGRILGEVMLELLPLVRPGVSELELDKRAEEFILQKGGKPGFKMVPGYHHASCISTNEVVVHGVPTNRVLKEGDIMGIDCGVYYGGYHTDMAETIKISNIKYPVQGLRPFRAERQISKRKDKIDVFLETGKKALYEGIKQARVGNRVGHISRAIQEVVEGAGYSVVRSLVGHGVGRKLHEKPEIPGRLEKPIEKTSLLKDGMTIAVEVIYNMGRGDVVYKGSDDWTIVTKDGSLSGVFERTILVTEKEPIILT